MSPLSPDTGPAMVSITNQFWEIESFLLDGKIVSIVPLAAVSRASMRDNMAADRVRSARGMTPSLIQRLLFTRKRTSTRRLACPLSAMSDICRGKIAFYSITSSAATSSVCGIVRANAFAVLRFITSSNLVGCMTGISAGFSPLRMRPV